MSDRTLRECWNEIRRLTERVNELERGTGSGRPQYPDVIDGRAIDWRRYPSLLDAHHLAEIYARTVGGVRKGLSERSRKLPTPCQVRPFKVRKDDCKRHWDRMQA